MYLQTVFLCFAAKKPPTFAAYSGSLIFPSLTNNTKAHLALMGTNLFFAINYTVIKFLINGGFIKSFGLNLVRVGVCAALLWVMFIFKPVKSKVDKKDYGRFFLCALTGIAINQLLFLKGLSLTFSIHASLLMLATPILITIFAAWILRERLTFMKILGLLLGITGAVILVSARDTTGQAINPLKGDIFIIINAISYTLYFILVKPLMQKYNPVIVIRMVFSFGLLIILPFCLKEFSEVRWEGFTTVAWINLASLVLLGTFLAYLFNVYGIKILGASIAGTYIYSQPIIAAILAMIFLGEELDMYKVAAGVLIAAGVYLSNKKVKHA